MDESGKKSLRRFRREIRQAITVARKSGSDGTAELGLLLEKASETTVYAQVKDCVGLALVVHQSPRISRAAVSPSPAGTGVGEAAAEPATA